MPDADKYHRASRALVFGTLIFLSTYALLSAAGLFGLYRNSIEGAKQNATVIAKAVERVFDSDLRGVALSIAAVSNQIEDMEELSDPMVGQELERIEDDDPLIEQSSIIGSDGMAVSKTDILPSGELDFSDRRYFMHHKAERGNLVFVDGPYVGRLMRRPYMTVSQRLETPQGEFRGVIVAAIDLNAYASSLARLEGGMIDVIDVFREDGTLLLRVPDPKLLAGSSFADTSLFDGNVSAREAGVFVSDSAPDGVKRYVGFAGVGGFPLVVTASIAHDTAAALWREALIFAVLEGLTVLVGAGALAGFGLFGLRRLAALEGRSAGDQAGLLAADTRQRSLFNALPANVALVDTDGTILDVNADWHLYARHDECARKAQEDGANYLDICDAAAVTGDHDARQVAAGMRGILAGSSQRFDIDYPCHSPTEQRWYHLTIAPIELGDHRGAVAMHFDVTARKLAEIALSEERFRLRRLAEGVPGVVFQLALDAAGGVHWNHLSDRCRDLFGLSSRDALEGDDLLHTVAIPADLPAIAAAVRTHLRDGSDLDAEFRVRRPDGEVRFVRAVARASGDDGSAERRSDGIFLDVTAEREAVARLSHVSTHDFLTGLLNRTEFVRRVEEALQEPRTGAGAVAVHVVGVDDFGDIGDAYGMDIGDAVLRAVADRIADVADAECVLARISGERFAVLQHLPLDATYPSTFAELLIARIREPLDVPGQTISFSASIGIAQPSRRTDTAAILITGAERALRHARKIGRGTFRFDEANSGLETQTRLALRSGLARALANGEFVLHFQPRVRLHDGVVSGCEALLRWQHPVFGMQSPAKFIPVAEQSGQIVPIGKWVLEEACRQAKQWLDAGHSDLRIAVNISAVQVTQSDIVATVEAVLAETGLPASALELEMTEAVAFDQSLRGQLDLIHDLGVSIAIDDFGTGFSSLGTLSSFPLDILKIDQSFVRKAPEVAADRVVVATVVDLARGLGLMTVAEGVETIEQAVLLQGLGCDEIQGYYIAMPMEAADFRWFLETGRERVRRKLQPLYSDAPQVVGGG